MEKFKRLFGKIQKRTSSVEGNPTPKNQDRQATPDIAILEKNRDRLSRLISDIPGVVSVGLGEKGGDDALVVAINKKFSDTSKSEIPEQFRGIKVIYRNFGDTTMYSTESEENPTPEPKKEGDQEVSTPLGSESARVKEFVAKFKTIKDQLTKLGFETDYSVSEKDDGSFETTIHLEGPRSKNKEAMTLLSEAGLGIFDPDKWFWQGFRFLGDPERNAYLQRKMTEDEIENAKLSLFKTICFEKEMYDLYDLFESDFFAPGIGFRFW